MSWPAREDWVRVQLSRCVRTVLVHAVRTRYRRLRAHF